MMTCKYCGKPDVIWLVGNSVLPDGWQCQACEGFWLDDASYPFDHVDYDDGDYDDVEHEA